jgi:hypothetical protein
MADDKDAAAKKAADDAKKAKEESVKAMENPPPPYPTQEQLDRIKNGESADEVLGEGAPADKPAPKPAARAMEADKPAGYQTR